MKLAEIENAILEAIRGSFTYLRTCEVASARDFDAEGNLIVIPPAVLVMYGGAEGLAKDVRGLSYQANPRWVLLAAASNLRGALEEKQGDAASGDKGVYDILDDLRALLAGKLLSFSGTSGLCVWRTEEIAQFDAAGTVFAATYEVKTTFVNSA